MENLEKMRIPLRGAFTRVRNNIVTELANEDPDKAKLKTNLEILEIRITALRQLDHQILQLMIKEDVEQEVYNTESYAIDEFTDSFVSLKNTVLAVCATKVPDSGNSVHGDAESGSGIRKKLRLPKLELQKFEGDVKDWLNFWSCFKRINDDQELAAEEKFQYLLQSVVKGSRAYEVVESYPPTAENYPKAVASLKQRFGREELQVEVYVRELLKLVLQNNFSKEKGNLTKLYDLLESYTRALESLGVTTDKCGTILYPLVESCLPDEVLRVWQRSQTNVLSAETSDPSKQRLNQLMAFLRSEVEGEERIRMARAGFGLGPKKDKANGRDDKVNVQDEGVPTAAGLFTSGRKSLCLFCRKDNHYSHNCHSAKMLTLNERQDCVQKGHACRICLKVGHFAKNCTSERKCADCGDRHNLLLCGNKEKSVSSSGMGLRNEESAMVQQTMSNLSSAVVSLQTLMCDIKCGNKSKRVRAIVDSGSQRSYVLNSTAHELGLEQVGQECIRQGLFGGKVSSEQNHHLFKLELVNLSGKYSCVLSALDQQQICSSIKRVPKGHWLKQLRGQSIYLSDLGNDSPVIEVLLGSDVAGKLFTGNKFELKCGLVVVETKLGWTLMGKVPMEVPTTNNSSLLVMSMMANQQDIENLWKLEVIGISDPAEVKLRVELEQAAMEHFQQTVKVNVEGRYEVNLPWLASNFKVGNNRRLAERRLKSTSDKLVSSGHLNDYNKVFEEWLSEGIIQRVPADELKSEAHYLPHRAVIKVSSATTKIRPVFDASSHEKGYPSLNDCLEKGPNLIEKIPAVLSRFRENKFGVISDIKKAFLQISVAKEDCDYMRFLWWSDADQKNICVYRHVRVVFGVSCSPFLLGAVLNHHLNIVKVNVPTLVKKLRDSYYVDNCVTSVSSVTEYVDFMDASKKIMAEGGFDLREWECSGDCENPESQVLGLTWDKSEDTLSVGNLDVDFNSIVPITKRKLLSISHKLFDPLGFTCPVSLYPKVLLQEAWELKIGWDKELPLQMCEKFLQWCKELKLLEDIKIPRWFTTESVSREKWSLHTFCDASKLSYAAAVYVRVDTSQGVTVQLALAKSRVAPVRKMTIPRLELMACLIGCRLTRSVVDALDLVNVPITYWSDSSTALSWIQNEDEWNIFVGNRVREIRKFSSSVDWRHVPGIQNPADLPSRGCAPKQLLESRWWEGPLWLKHSEEQWPKVNVDFNEESVNSEKRKTLKSTSASLVCTGVGDGVRWYSRASNDYEKFLRLVCYILKYRKWLNSRQIEKPEISVEDLIAAEVKILRLVQEESFGKVESNFIQGMTVFLGDDGLWRVKSRLERREDDVNFKYPVLLPADHLVVHSMIMKRHENLSHAGALTVLLTLREKFWVIRGRKTVGMVIKRCVTCRKFDAAHLEAVPSALPLDRVRDAAVFEVVGVDLAGPLYLRNGEKAWVVLYTCAVYRAVHLELVTGLSTEAFLQSLRRFIARRGRPSVVYSDRGTNFLGSDNAFRTLDWEAINKHAGLLRIQWRFNPATAAWWGGFWERLIRVLKGILKKVLGRASLNYEELVTILCDCEAVVNARPLTYLSEDVNDLSPLSPSRFLQDVKESGVADIDNVDQKSLSRRVKYRQKLSLDMKKRFRDEYMSQLVHRRKEKTTRELRVGEIVLVGADNVKRINWPLGRVIKLLPGSDSNVRVAEVKTATGVLVRPVQRLYPLEVSGDIKENNSGEVQESIEAVDEKGEDAGKILRGRATRCGRLVKTPQRFCV